MILRKRSSLRLILAGASLLAGLLVSELALRLAGFEFHLRPERITFAWTNSLASLGYRGDPDLLWVPAGYSQRLAMARAERPVIALSSAQRLPGPPQRVRLGIEHHPL